VLYDCVRNLSYLSMIQTLFTLSTLSYFIRNSISYYRNYGSIKDIFVAYIAADILYMMTVHIVFDHPYSNKLPILNKFHRIFMLHHDSVNLHSEFTKPVLQTMRNHYYQVCILSLFNLILYQTMGHAPKDTICSLTTMMCFCHVTSHIFSHYNVHDPIRVPRVVKILQKSKLLLDASHSVHHRTENTNFAFTELTNYFTGLNGRLGNVQSKFGTDKAFPFFLLLFSGGSTLILTRYDKWKK